MFRNYLVTALRNFSRHKLYSFINIAGLTVGLTCAIFIILFVRDQLSYDKWIPGTENLYRVEHTLSLPGQQPQPIARTPILVPQAMLEHVPGVKARTRIMPSRVTIQIGNRQFLEEIHVVDPNFFQLVQLPLTVGAPGAVLAQPESLVLSESSARKYFGHAPALGKTITLSAQYCDELNRDCHTLQHNLVVTGIMRDLPHNTHLSINLVMSNKSVADPTEPDAKSNWFHTEGWGYVQLADGADPRLVTKEFEAWMDRSVDLGRLMTLHLRVSDIQTTRLTPFVDTHLTTDQYGGMTPAGSWTTVYGFAAIGTLILLVACFNFTNLATARATLRAREISLRKVMGATRRQLIAQFLGESLLTAIISLPFALSATEMLLPLFDRFLGTPIEFRYLRDWPISCLVVAMAIAAGMLSGLYPAIILSAFRPATALRTNSSKATGSGLLRTVLVVLQFAVSIGLGIAALVVFAQISFARHIELGFQKDGIVVVSAGDLAPEARLSFMHALAANPNIVATSLSSPGAIPFANSTNNVDVHLPGQASGEGFRTSNISPDFPKVYGIPLLAGRLLSDDRSSDKPSLAQLGVPGAGVDHTPYNILINASAARRLGFTPEKAVGQKLIVHTTTSTIVGVIGDSRIDGADKPVAAMIYNHLPIFSGWLSIRVKGGSLPDTLAFIDRTWHAFAPSLVIRRYFLSDDFEKQFEAVDRQGTMFALFVGIAISIACLGLFGLASFAADRRTREIGLRKVFGARSRDIVWLLLWQFSIPVLIANLIAWPLAYYYLRTWLDGYAYRIGLSPTYFLAAGAAALMIAWSTVFAHASRVARASPIHALRYE